MATEFFEAVVQIFEVSGVLAMVIGFIVAIVFAVRKITLTKDPAAAFKALRTMIGSSILLGLEILVAADLVRTVTFTPSWEDTAILGLIVVIRTVLSVSIQIEIEGVLPWRRALLATGPEVMSRSIAHEFRDRSKPQGVSE